MIRALYAVTLVVAVAACTRTHIVPEPDGSVTRIDAGPPPARVCAERGGPVDVLFVIDNSNDMVEGQVDLAAELPSFIESLLDPPDRDGDGALDWLPAESLRLGVITSDMGTGGFPVPTCSEPDFGDDGILQADGNTAISGCMSTYPAFLSARPGDDAAAAANDLRCIAQMGTGGCGFEQPLEALLKAITPSTSPVRFFRETTGHGDRANAGLVRSGSLLAIVVLTDEDDCSASDPELYDPGSTTYPGNLNLRCVEHASAVHPVERYVEGILALRPGAPDLILYAGIVGVPTDLVGPTSRTDWEAMLADARMQERVDPADPNRILPSCNVPDLGLSFPPRRMVSVAAGLEARGATSVIQSGCQRGFEEPMRVIAEAIGTNACSRFLE